jgi:O-antigen/teichoic acid export membrane protein
MRTERLIVKNTLILGVGKAAGDIMTFVFLVYFSRSYGQEALGQYALAMATGGLLSIFVSLGLNTYTIREISKDRQCARVLVGQLFVLRLIFTFFCWGVIGLIALVAVDSSTTRQILLIIGAFQFIQRLIGLMNAGFLAHEEMCTAAMLGIIERLLILIVGVIGVYMAWPPALTLSIYPASAGAVLAAALLIFRRRHGWPLFRFHYPFIKKAVIEASPFFVIIILAQFYDRIGLIILTALQGETVTGIFSAGDRLLATVNGFVAVFATALFPSVSRLSDGNHDELEHLCSWAMRMVFIVLLPLATIMFVASDQIIIFAFGDGFAASAAMLRIACWTLVLFGFNRILSILMIANYRQGHLVRIRMLVYVCYFVLSVVLVWKYSYLGLAWSKIITETGLFLITFYFAAQLTPSVSTLKRFFWPAFLSLLPTLSLVMMGYRSWPILGLFAVLFATTSTYFAVIRTSDLKLLRPWLTKRIFSRPPDQNGDGYQ